jgi:VWFA-related protein
MIRKISATYIYGVLLVMALVATVPSLAQVVDEKTRVDTNLVLIDVLVMNRDVKPVRGLSAGQFELIIDGVKQPIETFSADAEPVSLGIVYDMHPTTTDRTRAVIESFQAFKQQLSPEDDVFLVAFDNRGLQSFDFVPKLEQLERHMTDPSRPQLRALYDAVYFASDKVATSRNQKRVLLIISDSADHRSRHSFADVKRKLASIRSEVYTVIIDENNGLGYKDVTQGGREFYPFTRDASALDRAALMELALRNGGGAFFAGPATGWQLLRIYGQIVAEMRTHYTIGFYPEVVDAKEHLVKVRLHGAPNSKEYVLTYRTSYRTSPTK